MSVVAGQKITCVNCDGKGYRIVGYGDRYPRVCSACAGTGKQAVRP